ncbi:hypothetical protein H8356DRAFT_930397 [Neocallimastix lanati (nom. inval.)]|jgi:hypothetical protein|uniref:Uncharacterized protein n=1 Tax=Neocallimastix californiae TaxID=1754190 RepID=A0A1Y2D0E2_9FUNG|nr:hypothetical protein H8356DRAFT_930397 [Neocallimastix sp. JGI-2020a]ORY52749.1 hypothetical protein LY90DRAFT_508104 [Neocallimastix californiae]|eukprot:ORY52749.1 hypothetical protein LY90DRAFT_508104 [Neocallimastix californiae]
MPKGPQNPAFGTTSYFTFKQSNSPVSSFESSSPSFFSFFLFNLNLTMFLPPSPSILTSVRPFLRSSNPLLIFSFSTSSPLSSLVTANDCKGKVVNNNKSFSLDSIYEQLK